MFRLIPADFIVPISYIKKDILGIEEMFILTHKDNAKSLIGENIEVRQGLIGVSLPSIREARWARDRLAMEQRAESLGVPIKVEVAQNSSTQQVAQIQNLISQGASILIVTPVDSAALVTVLENAHKAGVKIISYDRLLLNSNVDLYVSFDSLRVGELQGRHLIEKASKGNYIILSGDPQDNNSRLLKEGAMEYLKPYIYQRYIKIVTDKAVEHWDPETAYRIVKESLLANNNNIDAVLAANDNLAGAAIRALEEQGLGEIVPVTGQDADLEAAQRIVQRTQTMTVLKDSRELGKTAIDLAIKAFKEEALDIDSVINNGKIDVPAVLIEPKLVDISNIDEILIDSGYLNKNDLYKKLQEKQNINKRLQEDL